MMLLSFASLTSSLLLSSAIASAAPPGVKTRDGEFSAVPLNYGILLFRAYTPVDIFAPVDILQMHARAYPLNLAFIARTMDPVTTEPASAAMNPLNSSVWYTVPPTHTVDNPPPLDVLIVPGGPGTRSPDLGPEIDFIRRTQPGLKYLLTICTGAGIAAQAGVLDGRRATTNKNAWATITAQGPKVRWVSPARWVEDGNIWSSSGGTAGLDMMYRFLNATYPTGPSDTYKYSGFEEYLPITDPSNDPFAARYNIPTQN